MKAKEPLLRPCSTSSSLQTRTHCAHSHAPAVRAAGIYHMRCAIIRREPRTAALPRYAFRPCVRSTVACGCRWHITGEPVAKRLPVSE